MTNNTFKPGYKHTSLGWIPEDWEVRSLGNEIKSLEAGVSVNSTDDPVMENDFGILKTSAVFDGKFDPSKKKRIKPEDIQRAKLNPIANSIIVSRMNTPELVGECGYVPETLSKVFLPDRLWQTQFYHNSNIDVKWLNFLLNTDTYKLKIKSIATGTSNSMKNISKEAFLSICYQKPPLPEQKAIANILSTWDEAIGKTQELIMQKESRKKWLMKNLLSGDVRLRGFESEWKESHLGEVFIERNENKKGGLMLLSIGQNGVYPQSQSDKKDTSNEDKSKYKMICKGDIGYNTMRMWQGRSALSSMDGIVSPAYTIITPKENADSLFFSYLFKTPKLMNLFWRNSQGLVDDTLNCKFKDFSIIKVHLPEKKEQEAIAEILQFTDTEIELLRNKLEKLREQKKGLMQKLLTGEVRVKI